jgi:chorismate dehydratase
VTLEWRVPKVRVAAVSFLNTKPLIYGLGSEVELKLAVPSELLDLLRLGHAEVALLPVADIPKVPGAQILAAAGGIGSDGETHTVRIFSDRPIDEITTLKCDTDSHTSVQLARIILRERFGVEPRIEPLDRGMPPAGPCLLIGDKVIAEAPPAMPVQIDLGSEWKALTGLPFVFAAWTAAGGNAGAAIAARLARARQEGLAHVDEIVAEFAAARGWPPALLKKYYTEYLKYEIGPRELSAINLFWSKLT